MARSTKPSVWIDDRKAASGYTTYRVLFERDGERLPGLNCGPSRALAAKVKARLEIKLWERETIVERLLAELRKDEIARIRFAEDLLKYLTAEEVPTRHLSTSDTVTLEQWQTAYLAVCREQNRPSTVKEFDERAVNGFVDYAGAAMLLRSVDQDLVRRWKDHLQARGGMDRKKKPMPLGPTTTRMRLAHASAGFAWARKRGWIAVNPFDSVEKPKAKKHDRVLTADELARIYSEILPTEHQPWFTTLLWTGLRREELVSLTRPQVLRSRTPDELWRLKFAAEQTKNKKAKLVELHPHAQAAVAAAMETSSSAQVFEKLTLSKLQHWFEKISAKLGRVTPHTLKHTFCTRFMETTGDLDSLVLLTGNSRRSLELHYLHLSRPRSRVVLSLDFGYVPPALPQNGGVESGSK